MAGWLVVVAHLALQNLYSVQKDMNIKQCARAISFYRAKKTPIEWAELVVGWWEGIASA